MKGKDASNNMRGVVQNHSVDWLIGGSVTFVAGTAVTLLLGQSVQKAVIAGIATAGSGVGIAALQGSRIRSSQSKEICALQEKQNSLQEKIEEKSAAIRWVGELEELQQKVDWQRGEEGKLEEAVRQSELQLSQSRGEFVELQKRGELVRVEQQAIKGKIETENRLLATVLANLVPKQAEFSQLTDQLSELEREKQNSLQEKLEEKAAAIRLTGQLEELQQKIDWQLREKGKIEEEICQSELQLSQSRDEFSELQKRDNLVRAEHQEIGRRIEIETRSLDTVTTNFLTKQTELNQLIAELKELEQKRCQLQEQSTRLEFERSTFDALLQERDRLESKVQQLKPEKQHLEEELQRLLREIRDNVPEHNRISEVRQEINALEQQRRGLRRESGALEGRIAQMIDEQTSLEAKVRELNEKLKGLEGDSQRLVEFALQALKEPLWKAQELATTQLSFADEEGFIRSFENYVASRGFSFPSRVLRAFHTALKVQGISALVVLAGISGTGKSELPQLYADYIGAQFLALPVQPRWDSPQDLSGFYNYMENKFKPTSLLRGIYQYPNLGGDRIVIVLLDEMNLARVEYYFSDFLSKLESRRNHPENANLEIDLGSLPVSEKARKFPIPQQFLFVGTMNEDETTQTLSDKVLDRANILTFGKPKALKLSNKNQTKEPRAAYLTYSHFNQWFVSPDANSEAIGKVTEILDKANVAMEAMGHPFAHRVYQAIAAYVVNYPGAQDPNSEAFRSAIADQFAQKLLPKLRGVVVHEEQNQQALKHLSDIITTEINDAALQEAFKKAKEGQNGQFHWKGLVYPEA